MPSNPQLTGLVYALAGVLILTPDTLLVRLMDVDAWRLLVYRGAGMALGAACITMAVRRRSLSAALRGVGWAGVLVGLCFSTANILFVNALMRTSVANTLAIISTAPIWGAALTALLLKERLPARTWVAAGLSAACVLFIVAGDLGGPASHLEGDLIALAQAVFMAAGFVLVRRRRAMDMVPCMIISGTCTVTVSTVAIFTVGGGALAIAAADVPWMAMLCVVLPLSFFCLLTAPRYIPAPEVNMIMLLEMVLGPLLVWWVVGEAVSEATLLGGAGLFAVLLAHSLLAVRSNRKPGPGEPVRVGEASLSAGERTF